MVCDLKHKYITTVALNLIAFGCIALGFQSTALALGLSDIDVHSSLGEPLKASITVLGAQDLTSASCLTLGPESDIKHINFKLSPTNGSTANVSLTSNTVINEPIINLSVVAGCNHSIARHYVLLLDPPFSTQSHTAKNTPVETKMIAEQVKPITQPYVAKKSVKKPKASSKKKVNKKRASSKKLTQKSNRETESLDQAPTKTNDPNNSASMSDKPMLSISGGDHTPYHSDSTRLRLDTTLTLTPNSNLAPIMADDIMINDELTVVNNRIAHLQKQITSLEQQNLKLTSDNKLKTKQLTKTQSLETRFKNLLLFVAALLLLLLAYIIFTWLRRKQLEKQTNNTEALWVGVNKPQAEPLINNEPEADGDDSNDNDDESNADTKEEAESDLLPLPPTGSSEEPIVIEDEQAFSVLDHADVFLFHGRPALAIQLLQNYLTEHPKQSVTIWLFLLDLLAKEDLKDQYEEASVDCKLHYNIKIPDFSQQETEATESLEDFPRLAQGLCDVWNTPSALVYLDDLIYNKRLTPRAGLPRNLIEELTILKAISLENVNPADTPPLDKKKLAEIKEKEALLEKRKEERLAEMAKAEEVTKEKEKAEEKETSFEFTLIDK